MAASRQTIRDPIAHGVLSFSFARIFPAGPRAGRFDAVIIKKGARFCQSGRQSEVHFTKK